MGWARVEGPGDAPEGYNIPSPDEEVGRDGAGGKKACSLLSINGVLYLLVRNANNAGREMEIWSSTDHGVHWHDAGWNFAELGYGSFVNFGRDYAGARDEYVYLLAPNSPSAYVPGDVVVLARVPRDQIMIGSAWRFYAGVPANGNGEIRWSEDIGHRQSVLVFPRGCNRLSVTYNPGLGRYLMTLRARGSQQGFPNCFSILDAPEPWGPWTTVYYIETSLPGMSETNTRSGGWGESQHIPAKWISQDGRRFYLIYSGDDRFRTRGCTLNLRPAGPEEE